MKVRSHQLLPWIVAWLALSVMGGFGLARQELAHLRDGFEADVRVAHQLLSLRAVEHEAILATLALLDSPATVTAAQRLPAIYPRIVSVLRREGGAPWPNAARADALAAAEAASRKAGRAWGMVGEMEVGRLWLVLAGGEASHALGIDLALLTASDDWPNDAGELVTLRVSHAGHVWVISDSSGTDGAWRFRVEKRLGAASQPFDLVAERRVRWGELPWGRIGTAILVFAVLAAGGAALAHSRRARQRAEALLRVGQVGRLNALGEFAAGIAHELNQPLTAVLASTRAAERMLRDDPADAPAAAEAMRAAGEQARRAADVLARMRRAVERPDAGAGTRTVDLRTVVSGTLRLVEPEVMRLGVRLRIEGAATLPVRAEPVSLEQIVHNLLSNALHALEAVPAGERQLTLTLSADATRARLSVADSGPGIPEAQRARIFEPFYSTRQGGLGLGLPLCESLAEAMGGRIELAPAGDRGACFVLTLEREATDA